MGENHPTSYVPALIERLYQVVTELEGHFPGHQFTPDGHLDGSIGEVLGAYRYGLELLPCSTPSNRCGMQYGHSRSDQCNTGQENRYAQAL